MKRERILPFAVGFLMAELLTCGAMGVMISGLDLPVGDMTMLYRIWACCALAGCILLQFPRGSIAALVAVMGGLAYLLKYQDLIAVIRALITRLSVIYDGAYHWGVLEFAGVDWKTTALDPVFAAAGGLLALVTAGAAVSGRGGLAAVLLALPPLISTMVVINTVPDAPWLYALVLAMALMLLTATVRRQDPHQGARLTALAALPLALVLALLFNANPKDDYVNRSKEQLDEIVAWLQNVTTPPWGRGSQLGEEIDANSDSVSTRLSSLGPRNTWSFPVMEVTVSEDGTYYLRGQHYDTYTGSSWTADADREEVFVDAADSYYGGKITITTRSIQDFLYLPYYSNETEVLTGGRVDNEENLTAYTYSLAIPSMYTGGGFISFDRPETDLDQAAQQAYLALPEKTQAWAEAYVQELFRAWTAENGPIRTTFERTSIIRSHVRSAARYDTDTTRMDRSYDDFTRWFLEESNTGYCVHFATAATVLLRAAGVPARYVTGYMFSAEADVPTTVTADQAHAWVEYYEPAEGTWVVLEATPPDLGEEETEPVTDAPTEPPTEAPTEAPETQPLRPSDPNGTEDPGIDLTWLWTAMKWLLLLPPGWLAAAAQYRLRRKLRRRGSPNVRALGKWRDVARLCRLTGQKTPEKLEFLAQKAKFSQHTLTAEELHAFDAWLEIQHQMPRPWYLRFVCKYVLALW